MTGEASPATLHRPPTVDLVLLAVAVGSVSTSAPLIREAAAPALAVALWRNVLAAAVVVPTAALRRRDEVVALSRREWRLSALAGLFLAAHFATWVPSLSFTSVASSVALVATQPVWAAVIARVRGQRVPPAAWAGIALALAGVVLLSGVDLSVSARSLFGDGPALAGGVLAAAYVSVGADVRRTVSTTTYTAVCYSVAALGLLLAAGVAGAPLVGFSARTWTCLVALTVGPQLLGHSLVNRVLRTTSPTVVSVAILFEIVGAAAIARIAFGESPPAAAWPAAALIAAGVVLVVRAAGTPAPAVAPALD